MPKIIEISACSDKIYKLTKPIKAVLDKELDYYLCYDEITNMSGLGSSIKEAKTNYCKSLLMHYEFLNENINNLFDGYKKSLLR
ncbi:MAG: hypothetical protein ACYDIA_23485 [Candidatus Humimicrobiaceae bacterium]